MKTNLVFDGLTGATFSVDSVKRTLRGIVVPWNRLGRHSNGNSWRFATDSTKFGHAKYIGLNNEHVGTMKLGRATDAESTPEGLVMTFSVFDGPAGDAALAAALEGSKTGFSVEVDIDATDTSDDPDYPGTTLVSMANLTGVAFTASPAFTDARLISVMASQEGTGMPEETQTTETPETTPETSPAQFTQEQFNTWMADYQKSQAAARPVVDPTANRPAGPAQVTEPAPYVFSSRGEGKYDFSAQTEHQFSSDLYAIAGAAAMKTDPGAALDRVNDFIKKSFDVEIADVPGTRQGQLRPAMWVPQRDYATPLWDLVGRGTVDEMPFFVPKFTSSSGLVSAATEKVEPAPGTMVTESQTITPGQLWGKVDITRQLWRTQGTPALSGILWEQMLRSFFEAREQAIATFLNTLTAATDIVITAGAGTNASDIISANNFEAAIAALQFARGGNRYSGMAAHIDFYQMLARVTDTSGRKLYPMINPMNANGTAESLFSYLNVAGTRIVPAWALGATGTASANSWLFDPSVVMSWASAPERLFWDFGTTVQTTNIPQLSYVTLGLYANSANACVDISGVRQVTYDPVA